MISWWEIISGNLIGNWLIKGDLLKYDGLIEVELILITEIIIIFVWVGQVQLVVFEKFTTAY